MQSRSPLLAITIVQQRSASRSRIDANIVDEVLQRACKKVKCPSDVQTSVIFIGDAKMRELNRKYRGKDKTTNVLAFGAVAPHPPLSRGERKIAPVFPLPVRERVAVGRVRDLGDIFISLPEAKREAKKYGWTIKYEIARLALHGFLHLLGYDHEKEGEARKMERIERRVLERVE